MHDFKRKLGSNMRKARLNLGLTQAEVAESVDLLPEVYGRMERGAMRPSLDLLVNICHRLGATPDQLLGFSRLSSRAAEADA